MTKGLVRPQVSSHGRFRNLSGAISTPKPMKSGQIKIRIRGHDYYLATLICCGAHGPAPSKMHVVQHLNLDPTDNYATNLAWMTKKESAHHMLKTNNNHKSNAKRISKPIQGRKKATKAEDYRESPWTKYEMGATEAAKKLGLDKKAIFKCCSGKLSTTGGYEFQYELGVDLLPGEEFREVVFGDSQYDVPLQLLEDLNNSNRTLQIPEISNKGRWMDTQGVVKTPAPHRNGYSYVMIMGVNFGLHGLVCRAVHGPPPTEADTPHHIDRNPKKNHADNLCWSTKSERVQNSDLNRERNQPRHSKLVEGRKGVLAGDSGQATNRQPFKNQQNAAEVTGVSLSSVRNCYTNQKGEVWYDVVL